MLPALLISKNEVDTGLNLPESLSSKNVLPGAWLLVFEKSENWVKLVTYSLVTNKKGQREGGRRKSASTTKNLLNK